MKFATSHCPECGGDAAGILETLYATAWLSDPDPVTGEVEYAGESKVHWDTQEADEDSDKCVTVYCGKGHGWQTRVTW